MAWSWIRNRRIGFFFNPLQDKNREGLKSFSLIVFGGEILDRKGRKDGHAKFAKKSRLLDFA